jgi:hypothetical protein
VYPDAGSIFFASGNPDGTYLLEDLPEGLYMLVHYCADGGDWVIETWDNHPGFDFARANKVQVLDGVTTSQINSTLEPGGGISGTVTKKNGRPFPGCDAFPWSLLADGTIVTFGPCPDGSGNYRIGGAPAKNRVLFNAPEGYQSEFWRNKPDLASANVVKVPAGTTTTGIDGTLAKAPPSPPSGPGTRDGRPVVPVRAPNGLIAPS